jgi:hypothetical protein
MSTKAPAKASAGASANLSTNETIRQLGEFIEEMKKQMAVSNAILLRFARMEKASAEERKQMNKKFKEEGRKNVVCKQDERATVYNERLKKLYRARYSHQMFIFQLYTAQMAFLQNPTNERLAMEYMELYMKNPQDEIKARGREIEAQFEQLFHDYPEMRNTREIMKFANGIRKGTK